MMKISRIVRIQTERRFVRKRVYAIAVTLFTLSLRGNVTAQTGAPAKPGILSSVQILEEYGGVPNRNLDEWKKDIASYSLRHYGVAGWHLAPTAIILHYTASAGFPLNLIESQSFQNEAPGVASHFVVDETDGHGLVYQILPLDVMSRATFGANFCSISIEIVAMSETELLGKQATLDTVVALVRELMARYDIPLSRVYGHSEIDAFLAENPHGEFFDNTIQGSFVPRKVDPGPRVMALVRAELGGDQAKGAGQ